MGTDLVLGFRLGPGLPALGFDISNATGVSFCDIVESAEALDFVIEPVSRQFFAGFLGHPSTKVRWRTRHDPGSALCCTWYTWAEQKVFACAPRVATVR